MNTLLEGSYWLDSLSVREAYIRKQDDTDGKTGQEQELLVSIGPDGDAWVVPGGSSFESLRFRSLAGGGKSLRVRNALLILAEAIRRDNEEHPQDARLPQEKPAPDSSIEKGRHGHLD